MTSAPCARNASITARSRRAWQLARRMPWYSASEPTCSKKRMRASRRIPDRYIDHVYGETENGGTSYLILSHVPFSELGLPNLGSTPVKEVSEISDGPNHPIRIGLGSSADRRRGRCAHSNQKKEASAKQVAGVKRSRWKMRNENADSY